MSDDETEEYRLAYDIRHPANSRRRDNAEKTFNEVKEFAARHNIDVIQHTTAHYQVRGDGFIYDIWPGTKRYRPVKGDEVQIYLEGNIGQKWFFHVVEAIVNYFSPSFESITVPQSKLDYINGFKTFGEQWKLDSIRGAKVDIYIVKFLRRNDAKSKITTPFRCCTEGVEVYSRRDCKPLTANDIEALKAMCKGQRNSVQGNPGDMEATHSWMCDSSD